MSREIGAWGYIGTGEGKKGIPPSPIGQGRVNPSYNNGEIQHPQNGPDQGKENKLQKKRGDS